MTKRFFYFLALFVGLFSVGCSDGYDADSATSLYKPVEGRRMVAKVKTTKTVDGRNYSWEHNFSYDAQGRIKEINSVILHHQRVTNQYDNATRWYVCNITSKANYYYDDEKLAVYYSVEKVYPEYPDWNNVDNGHNNGVFNENGVLEEFALIDFEYSLTNLLSAYIDGDIRYDFIRERGDVTGFVKYDDLTNTVKKDCGKNYSYSGVKNNTNFDFSAYFGYWEVEQNIIANRAPYYASYQLGAFGMLGSTSVSLPLGQILKDGDGNPVVDEHGQRVYEYGTWKLDETKKYPLEFVDATGRKTEITYVD